MPLYGPPLVLAVGVGQALAIIAAMHLLWAFVLRSRMPINVSLSIIAALAVSYLQWPVAVAVAVAVGFVAHNWVAAIAIFLMPWLSGLIGFVELPVWWVIGTFRKNAVMEDMKKSGIGVIQRRLLSQIGWTVGQ